MRTVFCKKYQQDLKGLDAAPYPGEEGQFIYDNISEEAWNAWLGQLTMIINEHRLNPLDPNTKTFIHKEMMLFFDNKSTPPEGYTNTET